MEKVEDLGGKERGVTRGEESLVSCSPHRHLVSSLQCLLRVFARAPSELRRLLVASLESGQEVHPQEVQPLGDSSASSHRTRTVMQFFFFLFRARLICNSSLSPACCLTDQPSNWLSCRLLFKGSLPFFSCLTQMTLLALGTCVIAKSLNPRRGVEHYSDAVKENGTWRSSGWVLDAR